MIAEDLPIACVIADRPCRALDIARTSDVPAALVERHDWSPAFDRRAYTLRVLEVLADAHIDLVAMAGFGTILGEPIFDAMPERVINTHPALLPSFPGWHAVRDALDYGVKVTGCTVHVATPVVDNGPILAQAAVVVRREDDESSLHERIKTAERTLYVDTLRTILDRGRVLETT